MIVRALRDYQLVGVDWLLAMYDLRSGCVLADESALGKKVQAIAHMARLASARRVWGPHLVVTPTGHLPRWTAEFNSWFPASKICVYYGVTSFSKRWDLSDRRQASCLCYSDMCWSQPGQGKLEKDREFQWSGKVQGKIVFGKVSENEKLVPPDVGFSG